MGFLDKAKENIEKVTKQGQDKLDEVQTKKKADGLLRDLGAWTYAVRTGRDKGTGPAEVERIYGELQALEDEHGPLGGSDPDQPSDAAGSTTTPAPPAMTPPAPAAPPAMTPPAPPATTPPAPMTPPITPPASLPPDDL